MAKLHFPTGLTGGGSALDGITSANYSSLDRAITVDASSNIHYVHVATKPGSITESSPALINANDASGYWTLKEAFPSMGMGHLYGFEPSYSSTTVMNFTAGECMDSGNTHAIVKTTTLSLNIAASGANGLNGVARAVSATIHVHAILNPSTGVVAVVGTTLAGSYPAGYTVGRLIYSFKLNTTGSGEISDFVYVGSGLERITRFKTPVITVTSASHTAAKTNHTLKLCPSGIRVLAFGNLRSGVQCQIMPPDASDAAPTVYSASPIWKNDGHWESITNVSSQIATRTSGASTLGITEEGYKMFL